MAPEICNSFLKCKFCKEAKVLLTEIHKQCRDKHPENRPTIMQLHHKYSQVAQKMQEENEKVWAYSFAEKPLFQIVAL